MTLEQVISFFETNKFQHIPAKMREFRNNKYMTDYHKIKRFLLKMIRHSCFILPREYQHIKSNDVYMLSPAIVDEKLQQYMNITLSYANIWVDCCMVLFLSDIEDVGQYYDGFMSYSIFVEQNIEASNSE
jgi:hypothetical protein